MSAQKRKRSGAGEDDAVPSPPAPKAGSRGKRVSIQPPPPPAPGPSQSDDDNDSDGDNKMGWESQADGSLPYSQTAFSQRFFESQTADFTKAESKTNRLEQLPADQREKVINQALRYVLLQGVCARKPIKVADLTSMVLNPLGASGLSKVVLAHVQKRLQAVFGFELCEQRAVPDMNKQAADNAIVRTNVYDVRNVLRGPRHLSAIAGSDELPTALRGLTIAVLAIIYVHRKCAEHDTIVRALQELDDGFSRGSHPLFGDVNKLLVEDFVQTGVLHKEKAESGSGKYAVQYQIGSRARVVITVPEVVEFIIQTLKLSREQFTEAAIQEWMGVDAEVAKGTK